MVRKLLASDDYELTHRDSGESKDSFDLDAEDPETQALTTGAYEKDSDSIWSALVAFLNRKFFLPLRPRRSRQQTLPRTIVRRCSTRRIFFYAYMTLLMVLIFAVLTAVFRPSYTHPPARYTALRQQILASNKPGRGNTRNEKIFIAASIFDPDGELAQGYWGAAVLKLVDILGPENVYLSIYENNAGKKGKEALSTLEQKVECGHRFVFDDHFDPDTLPHVSLPDGTKRVKRITYLAEVRNRALKPLEVLDVQWDKLLYLNDVIFDPVEAAQLLFLTHAEDGVDGRADYRAACATDFMDPIKFYDTFATRDAEGFSMGLPFYPWFTDSGSGQSRKDVLAQKEAIMVKSCWGGMVAFDAKYFQFQYADKLNTAADQALTPSTGFRFRAENDLYWDASECCLINADIQSPEPGKTGIYLNPFIRVAYDTRTFSWLGFSRRFERLYTPIHFVISHLVGLPWHNPRRAEEAGSEVEQRVWVPDETIKEGGSFKTVMRKADHAGFCGRRALQVMLEHPVVGQRPYESLEVPP